MRKFWSILPLILLLLLGCQQDRIYDSNIHSDPIKIILSGSNNPIETKLSLGSPQEGTIPFLWNEGDGLGLYVSSNNVPVYGNQNVKTSMDSESISSNSLYPYFTNFSTQLFGLKPNTDYHFFAYYPYSPEAGASSSNIKQQLPAYQLQKSGNVSDHLGVSGAFTVAEFKLTTPPSLEQYSPQINFVASHKTSYILFSIKANSGAYSGWKLRRITITAPDGTYLSGNMTYNSSTQELALYETSSASSTIALEIASGINLSSTPVRATMVVFPADMKNKSLTCSYTLENSTGTERAILHRTRNFSAASNSFKAGTVYYLDEVIPSSPDGTVWIENEYPSNSWNYAAPGKYGYKSTLGQEINSFIANKMTTTGLMVIVGGEVIHSYGNVSELSYLASCRKSILSMMYGKYVENGTINLSRTMNDLDIEDVGGLLPIEKTSTIFNCITARSGVYHLASNTGDDRNYAPVRGSKTPGSYFLYNNWDFNVAGTIFENLVGRTIYSVFQSDLAVPLQFQDFSLSAQRKGGTLTISQFPAYHFYLSVRDMARLGYLMLRKGKWHDKQIISENWVETITGAYTRVNEMNPSFRRTENFGYGYMWWVWDGSANQGAYANGYTAIGAGGQFITVLPALDMVIVQKTSTNNNDANFYWQLVQLITESQIDK